MVPRIKCATKFQAVISGLSKFLHSPYSVEAFYSSKNLNLRYYLSLHKFKLIDSGAKMIRLAKFWNSLLDRRVFGKDVHSKPLVTTSAITTITFSSVSFYMIKLTKY